MSRWINKLTGLPKNAFWKRYSTAKSRAAPGVKIYVAPQLRSPLTAYAKSMIKLRKVGFELVGICPACAGRLRVGRERWRCLDCAGQEVDGADLAGMRAFLSRCPK